MESAREPSRAVNIGSVLGRSLREFFQRPLVYIVMIIVALLPCGFLLTFVPVRFEPSALLLLVGPLALLMVAQGAIAYVVFHRMARKPSSIVRAFVSSMKRLLPMFGAVCLIWGSIVVCAYLILKIASVMELNLVLCALVVLVLVTVALCALSLTIQVCVVERLSATGSIRRSLELTKGCRRQIFILLLICFIADLFVGRIIRNIDSATGGLMVVGIVSVAMEITARAFMFVVLSVLYYDIRNAREGVNIETLSDVFD